MTNTDEGVDVPDVGPGEFVVELRDDCPDDFGKRHFVSYWLDTNLGYYRNEKGIRGQVFYTSPEEFQARIEANGNSVRFLEEN